MFRRAATDGIAFTPVTSVSRSADVAAALAHRTNGIALRLSRTEFEAGNLERMLLLFMSQHGLSPEETDLIVDLGAVDDLVSVGIEAMAAAFLADVPDHTRWKTFTLTSSAFPPGMGAVDRHSYDLVDRADWLTWCQRLHGSRQLLTRLPTYSDGAIQHPKGVEGFDPRIMQVSASIRYTTSHSWLLIKGEGTRITPPSLQFPKLATQLVYGHLHLHYSGADHCAGCDSMMAAADGAPGLGSAEAWRRLGTVHHITTVVEQLGALPWP